MLQILFLLALPLLVAVGSALVTWNALSSPWKFMLSATATLYVVYGAVLYLLGPATAGYELHVSQPGEQRIDEPLFVFVQPFYTALLVFALLALPTLLLLRRTFKR